MSQAESKVEMHPRLEELLSRLSACGRPGDALSASEFSELVDAVWALQEDRNRMHAILNTPEIIDFGKAVVHEAAFQLQKWSADDGGKEDADWFWLIGFLAGKALHNPLEPGSDAVEKRLHRIITVAAAAANWHAQVLRRAKGENWPMRPGIETPKD